MLTTATIIAALFYLAASVIQWQVLSGQRQYRRGIAHIIGGIGFAAHSATVFLVLHQPDGINLGFFSVSSLIAWLIAGLVLASSMRQNVDNLFAAVFPLALVTCVLATFGPITGQSKPYTGPLISHILLSILAYSIFTIAVLQAVLLSRQHAALKRHHTKGLVSTLPPLQTMEQLLFEMLWTGMILLTASLATGFLFVDDLFAQHLVHKTALSLMAWVLFAGLLAGRMILGWRSHTAVRWTIGGFVFLMLGFFGSKLVMDFFVN